MACYREKGIRVCQVFAIFNAKSDFFFLDTEKLNSRIFRVIYYVSVLFVFE
jgi:hypothetical protein